MTRTWIEHNDNDNESIMTEEDESDSEEKSDNEEYTRLHAKVMRKMRAPAVKSLKKLTVTVGKVAADKRKNTTVKVKAAKVMEIEEENGDNILDYSEASEEEEEEDSVQDLVKGKERKRKKDSAEDEKERLKEERRYKRMEDEHKVWTEGEWKIDPRKSRGFSGYGPKLIGMSGETSLDYFLHFLPQAFIQQQVIPAINKAGKQSNEFWSVLSYQEYIRFLGIIYSMEVLRLPNRKMYWATEDVGFLKAPNYGRYMTRNRFDSIMSTLQYSSSDDKDMQIIDFIEAVNNRSHKAITPGDIIMLDESMVKSFHRNLKGKMKIIRKPRAVMNLRIRDGRSYIVIFLELYEGAELMRKKEYTDKHQATTATCLRLTQNWQNSGRLMIADSWFGSVYSSVQLMQILGLHSIMLVKTAH